MKLVFRAVLIAMMLIGATSAQQITVGTPGSTFNPASPGPIGTTTPSTAAFTGATVSGAISSADTSTTVPNTQWVNGQLHSGSPMTYGARIFFQSTTSNLNGYIAFGNQLTTLTQTASTGASTLVLTASGNVTSGSTMYVQDVTNPSCLASPTTVVSKGGTNNLTLTISPVTTGTCSSGDTVVVGTIGSLLSACQFATGTTTTTAASNLAAALQAGSAPCASFSGLTPSYWAVASGASVWISWPTSAAPITVVSNTTSITANTKGFINQTSNGVAIVGGSPGVLPFGSGNGQVSGNGNPGTAIAPPGAIACTTYTRTGGSATNNTVAQAPNTCGAALTGTTAAGSFEFDFTHPMNLIDGQDYFIQCGPNQVLSTLTLSFPVGSSGINMPTSCSGGQEFDFHYVAYTQTVTATPPTLAATVSSGYNVTLNDFVSQKYTAATITCGAGSGCSGSTSIPSTSNNMVALQYITDSTNSCIPARTTITSITGGSNPYTINLSAALTSNCATGDTILVTNAASTISCGSGSGCSGATSIPTTTKTNMVVGHNIYDQNTACIPAGTTITSFSGASNPFTVNLSAALIGNCATGDSITTTQPISIGNVISDPSTAGCIPANDEILAIALNAVSPNIGQQTLSLAFPLAAQCTAGDSMASYIPQWNCANCMQPGQAGTGIAIVNDVISGAGVRTVYSGLSPTTSTGTNNSAQLVLNVTSAANFAVGDVVVDLTTPAHLTANTTVASISVNAITLSQNIATTINAGEVIGVEKKFTWTKPTNAVYVRVDDFGCGGSGAGGSVVTPTGSGGGGGGGGSHVWQTFAAADLGATVNVQICSPGTGGAAGAAGLDPVGTTTFGTALTAYNGGAGSPGSASGGTGGGGAGYTANGSDAVTTTPGAAGANGGAAGGAVGAQGTFNLNSGNGSGGAGGVITAAAGSAAISAGVGGCVGGAAGGGSNTSATKVGGAGVYPLDNGSGITAPLGGTQGTNGGNGGSATATSANLNGGAGGGGGAASTGTAGNAGTPSGFCAGGSGGGLSLSGTAGTGSAGAPGGVVVAVW
jgi:hypothetical protein